MMHLSMSMFHVKHPFGQACDVRGNVAGNGTVPVSGVGSGKHNELVDHPYSSHTIV